MALFDAFLKIEGIKGESTDKDHPDEIVIHSWSWGLGNPASPSAAGGGAGAGKVAIQDFNFTMPVSKASPVLMQACATAKHFKDATLSARKAGERQQDFLVFKMTDVLISSYQTDGNTDSEIPTDHISLNFTKIEFNYTVGDVTGIVSRK